MYLEAGVFLCIDFGWCSKNHEKVDERCLAPSRSRSESIADTLRKAPILISGKKETWTNLQLFQKLPVEWSTRAARHLNQPLTIEAWNMTNTYPDGSQCIIRLKTHGWSRWWTHRGTHLVDCDAHRIMKQIDFPLTICDTFYSNNLKLQWNLTSNQILKVFLI